MLHARFLTLSIIAVAMLASMAHGQSYPAKLIRIVTADAGGALDFEARLIAQGIAPTLGQQVVVENRGGANGILAGQTIVKSAPDGYALLYYGSTVWLQPFLQDGVPYDPMKDFSPITLTVSSSGIIVVHPSLAANSVKELIALARSSSGELNYGTGGSGSYNHLAAELFNSMAGVKIVRVPYKGGAAALNDVIGGRLQLMFSIIASGMPHVKSGRLRALAITGLQRSSAFPELPTVAASGLPGYESVQISGMFAPAKTPDAVVNRLNQEIVSVLYKPEFKERFVNAGSDVIASTPTQLGAAVKADMEKMGKVIRDAGIRNE